MLKDGEEFEVEKDGQRWASSWHSGPDAPEGRQHGSAGICVTADGGIVVVSGDGRAWDFPAGRPEGEESWEQTLRRGRLEAACAVVEEARLLWVSRGSGLEGTAKGMGWGEWRIWVKVKLLEWKPEFEIGFRKVVSAGEAIDLPPKVFRRIWERAFGEAGLPFVNELEQTIRRRFLDRVDDPGWRDHDPSFYGVDALPYFVAAFEKERASERRAKLVRAIWQFRDRSALPTLAIALADHADTVWQDALDGIVTLGGEEGLAILKQARAVSAGRPKEKEKVEWIDEAAEQIVKQMRNERDGD